MHSPEVGSVDSIMYGETLWLQNGNAWLTGARNDGSHDVFTRYFFDGGREEGAPLSYSWQVRSNAGNGQIGSIREVDPAAGQCVKYGDLIFLQSQSIAKRWLTGGRNRGKNDVFTRNHFANFYERISGGLSYRWNVRSAAGNGTKSSDIRTGKYGECVNYDDVVFLQVRSTASRWLVGNTGQGNQEVFTRNQMDGYEQTHGHTSYLWRFVRSPKDLRARGEWRQEVAVHTTTTYTVKVGWSTNVSREVASEAVLSVKTGFSVNSRTVSNTLSARLASKLSTSLERIGLTTREEKMSAEDGAYVWSWVFSVYRGEELVSEVYTDAKVQADKRPHCLPGEGADAKYTVCKPEACIEQCHPFKVGDLVLVTESGRIGEIREKSTCDRHFHIAFRDLSFPQWGWYPELALSIDRLV